MRRAIAANHHCFDHFAWCDTHSRTAVPETMQIAREIFFNSAKCNQKLFGVVA